MKNSFIMASLLASLAAAPACSQADEVNQKKPESTTTATTRPAETRNGKAQAPRNLPRNSAANARRRL